MKEVQLKEKELKYTVEVNNKNFAWDREFIIYQWYDNSKDNYESKFKLIIDLQQLTQKFVKVEKNRTSTTTSDKKVTYLELDDFLNLNFMNLPFVMKRRSIKGNVHLDRFIHANYKSEYLLEIEDNTNPLHIEELIILEDVSENPEYLNINMTIPFQQYHKIQLEELCKLIK